METESWRIIGSPGRLINQKEFILSFHNIGNTENL
jgi:hypothetical protein